MMRNKTMKTKKYPEMKIEWMDAYASLDDDPIKPYLQTTLGFKTGETKDYIKLSQNLVMGEPNSPSMHILKKTVIRKWII